MNLNDPAVAEAKHLAARLASLAGEERAVLVAFLHHLIEFDQKFHYAKLGYASLFAYCTDELRLSIGSTSRRITTARLMAKFPVIADFLADGRLTLVRVSLLKHVLTQQNHLELLRQASMGTERDVEVLVATLRPEPDALDSIRKLPTRRVDPSVTPTEVTSPPTAEESRSAGVTSSFALHSQPHAMVPTASKADQPTVTSIMEVKPGKPDSERVPRMEVHPTSAKAYAVRMSVSREFIDEFEQVKAALSHKFPNGRFEDVLRECFRITLEVVERRRLGSPRATARAVAPAVGATDETSKAGETTAGVTPPSAAAETASRRAIAACGTTAPPKPRSRYIPTAARRAVWTRDGGRCAFVSGDGKRCGSRHQVEIHHVDPFATGGPSTVENLSLRCRLHNHVEAVLSFGEEFMKIRVQTSSAALEAKQGGADGRRW